MGTEFLIVGGIFSAVLALFVCLVCWCNMEKSHPIVRLLVGGEIADSLFAIQSKLRYEYFWIAKAIWDE